MTDKIYTRYLDGEWSALYVDGKLAVVGDHYLTDNYLSQELGVNEIHSADFLTEDQKGALPTLAEVVIARNRRADREQRALNLRVQAEALIRQAEELENM